MPSSSSSSSSSSRTSWSSSVVVRRAVVPCVQVGRLLPSQQDEHALPCVYMGGCDVPVMEVVPVAIMVSSRGWVAVVVAIQEEKEWEFWAPTSSACPPQRLSSILPVEGGDNVAVVVSSKARRWMSDKAEMSLCGRGMASPPGSTMCECRKGE